VRFLLDSNAVIALLQGRPGLLARVHQHQPDDFGLPAIVAHELFYGAYKSQTPARNLARLDQLQFEVLAFDHDDARCAGDIRAALAAIGQPIGPYDVLIAGQALARDLTLITHNTSEFRRVPRLLWEDWE
jgi:tRNA(fMet)-specific endonuclease VapC